MIAYDEHYNDLGFVIDFTHDGIEVIAVIRDGEILLSRPISSITVSGI